MIQNFQLNDSQAVFGKDEYTYKRVIDDFQKYEFKSYDFTGLHLTP